MEELKEKDCYKQLIIKMIESIDNLDVLAYLYTFIDLKTKAGH